VTLRDKFELAVVQHQLAREEGQTMAEYGILIAVIALAAAIGAAAFGGDLSNFFTDLKDNLNVG
jgi:Flp pilus assembly pilin Flp